MAPVLAPWPWCWRAARCSRGPPSCSPNGSAARSRPACGSRWSHGWSSSARAGPPGGRRRRSRCWSPGPGRPGRLLRSLSAAARAGGHRAAAVVGCLLTVDLVAALTVALTVPLIPRVHGPHRTDVGRPPAAPVGGPLAARPPVRRRRRGAANVARLRPGRGPGRDPAPDHRPLPHGDDVDAADRVPVGAGARAARDVVGRPGRGRDRASPRRMATCRSRPACSCWCSLPRHTSRSAGWAPSSMPARRVSKRPTARSRSSTLPETPATPPATALTPRPRSGPGHRDRRRGCERRAAWARGRRARPASSFEVRSGEVVALTGESGAGKSTLLAVILGMIEPPRVARPRSSRITPEGGPFRTSIPFGGGRPGRLGAPVAVAVRRHRR